jgi:hemerythrin
MTTTYPISVDSDTVSFEFSMANKDPAEFKRNKEEAFRRSFVNVGNINNNVTEWNQALPQCVNQLFDARKKHFAAENDFFAAINVAPDPRTSEIFTASTIKRRVIPQPAVSTKKHFSSVPTMADEMYEDVLKVLYEAGRAMERKPSLYRGKDEEDLRDQFLLFLETRYSATTGTGETFNKAGKTDMLLKYEDGTNLFVAECKWWKGEAEFHAAIKQLFDRYLTWRDSKAALLLFVANKDFSAVVEKVRAEAEKSPYFVRRTADRDETSLAFDFHLLNDEKRIVRFAVLLFAFP